MTNTADSTANMRSPFEEENYQGGTKLPTATFPRKSEALQNVAANGALASAAAPIVLDEDEHPRNFREAYGATANNATVSGNGVGEHHHDDNVGEYKDHQHVDVNFLQHRLAAAEAESARHVQIISSMHEWAYKTTTSLRQVQEKCENAENRAKMAESEVKALHHQLIQVAAQVEAMAVAAASPPHAQAAHGGGAGTNDGGQSKRRRKKELPRVNTLTSLAADGRGSQTPPRAVLEKKKSSDDKNNNHE